MSTRKRSRPHHTSRRERTRQNADSVDSLDDLLVFGYSCKLFRDDEIAAEVEQGHFLQPWRESPEAVYMDRYDVRNLLDMLPEDPQPGQAHLDPDESAYDVERYADLDSEEEELYSMSEDERESYLTEKRKRRKLEADGRPIGIPYDYGTHANEPTESCNTREDFQMEHIPPPEIAAPQTKVLYDRIVRTATFLTTSTNPQTRLLLNTKQADNPEFGFLKSDHPLHPYFEFVQRELTGGLAGLAGYASSTSEDGQVEVRSADQANQSEAFIETQPQQSRLSPEKPVQGDSGGTGPYITPSTRVLIDKIAEFVAKNGPAAELKIREKNRESRRFGFLLPWNVLHVYYRTRVTEYEAALGVNQEQGG
ncbi:alternative splicing regulator-domain-containing protein [Gaertneriomyces semiglobifer]|nr:alternative splicing regulator-domain-containing protein [Gaertneriomyces semiglobifer]